MAGCLPLESIRQSTLECFYQQSCIDILSSYSTISRPKPLQSSLSKFPLNITIALLFDKYLFVESWRKNISFEKYFTACAPRSLTYSYQVQFHLPTIFTICVSAFGGLVIGWQLITPAMIKIWFFIKSRKQEKQDSIPAEQNEIEKVIMKVSPKPINKGLYFYIKINLNKSFVFQLLNLMFIVQFAHLIYFHLKMKMMKKNNM